MLDHWLTSFEASSVRTLDAGEYLFRRNDKVEMAFLVREGHVLLRRALKDGGLLTLHSANAGDLVAEASLFADHYHCDAVTDRSTKVSGIPKAKILENFGNGSSGKQLSVRALERTTRELQALRTRIEIMRLRKVTDRLDAYLELNGPPKEGGWVHVADWIGVTPAALYRELAKRRRDDETLT
jgi:CRP-like cAMP-binding protein